MKSGTWLGRMAVALIAISAGTESARAGSARSLDTTPAKIAFSNSVGGTPVDVALRGTTNVFVITSEGQLLALDQDLIVQQSINGIGTPVAIAAAGTFVYVALDTGVIAQYTTALAPVQSSGAVSGGPPVDITAGTTGEIVFVATSNGEVHKVDFLAGTDVKQDLLEPLTSIRVFDASDIYVGAATGTIWRVKTDLVAPPVNLGTVSAAPIDITSNTATGNVVVATTGTIVRVVPAPFSNLAVVANLAGVDMDASRIVAATSSGEVFVYNLAGVQTGTVSTPSQSTSAIAINSTPRIYMVGGSSAIVWGDPHIVTVDGIKYDYQGAGEFVLVRSKGSDERPRSPIELQIRATPVPTSFRPGGDGYTEIPVCVSVTTAVAARVGKRRVTYQPSAPGAGDVTSMQVRIDGVVTALGPQGLDLGDGGRVVPTSAGIEIDFPDGSIVFVTPAWWSSQSTWYLNVSLAVTSTVDGLAGPLPEGSWLPALPTGESMGPKPQAIHDRFVALYGKFGEAWRVTDQTSLFDYAPGQSTSTYALPSWPSETGSCAREGDKPATPIPEAIAKEVCEQVEAHNAECVFDVMATGHAGFATAYALSATVRPQPRVRTEAPKVSKKTGCAGCAADSGTGNLAGALLLAALALLIVARRRS